MGRDWLESLDTEDATGPLVMVRRDWAFDDLDWSTFMASSAMVFTEGFGVRVLDSIAVSFYLFLIFFIFILNFFEL